MDSKLVEKYSIQERTPGDGDSIPQKGQTVTVHYDGTFPETGKKFDSSRDRGKPFQFTLGAGQVIKGWDEVVATMSVGQKVYFICPPECAYGSKGAGGIIPPNAKIAFEVELISYK